MSTTTREGPTVAEYEQSDYFLDLNSRLEASAARVAAARAEWKAATDEAAGLTREAKNAGITEVDIAAKLGVDRARTVRRWLAGE